MNNVLLGFIDSLFEKDDWCMRIFMDWYGMVEEVVGLIFYLVGDIVGYIIGQNIWVDGGLIWLV